MTLEKSGQAAAAVIGIEWRDVPHDGRWHEVPAIGKDTRNGAGRIRIFSDEEGGTVRNWITEEVLNFWARREVDLDPIARDARRKRLETQRAADEEERLKLAAKAAGTAGKCWKAGQSPEGNHYLVRKGNTAAATMRQIDAEEAKKVFGYSPKGRGEELTGQLLIVPIKIGDKLTSCQLIDGEGRKHFLYGGALRGGLWSTGKLPHGNGAGITLLIAEGVATALSLEQATGYTAVAALSCGNLPAVAVDLRKRYPAAVMIVCSDKGNGEEPARRAANESFSRLAIPEIDGDGTDFNDLHTLSGLDAVKEQIERAKQPIPEHPPAEERPAQSKPESRIFVIDAIDFMAKQFPPRENLLSPWMPRQGLALLYAMRGIGKTHFSLGVAYAVATGGKFFTWEAPTPRGVLFIDGEMPGAVLQERLARIVASNDKEPTAPLRIITPDLQPNGMLDLSRPKDQADLVPYLEGIDLIILDNLSTLCRSGKESEGEGWLPVQEWALMQRAAGRSVLFIHHAGKNGEQRGTSRREDVLDTVIALRRSGDYTPDKGACFEVHFEKARGIYGSDTKPFEAQLFMTSDGAQTWSVKALEQSTAEKVATALNEGLQQHEIAELLGINKGTVSRAKKKAQEQGLLKVV